MTSGNELGSARSTARRRRAVLLAAVATAAVGVAVVGCADDSSTATSSSSSLLRPLSPIGSGAIEQPNATPLPDDLEPNPNSVPEAQPTVCDEIPSIEDIAAALDLDVDQLSAPRAGAISCVVFLAEQADAPTPIVTFTLLTEPLDVQGFLQVHREVGSSGDSVPPDGTPAESTPAESTPAESTPAESTPTGPQPSNGGGAYIDLGGRILLVEVELTTRTAATRQRLAFELLAAWQA